MKDRPIVGDTPAAMHDVVIIGGGQAGLSASWQLTQRGIDHVVLEQHATAHAWRHERWDSFCLVTPNWQCTLPGYPYAGRDPHGFMLRDEIVAYVEGYAASFGAPVRKGAKVVALQRNDAGYRVCSEAGEMLAGQVIVATGGYHDPIVPSYASALDPTILQIHSSEYRSPDSMPEGAVLVVGTGQSGCQIAEDLHLAGRAVHLCVGEAPRVARRYRGRDVVEWLHLMGYYDIPVDEHPLREGVRDKTNHYVTGRDGGRDIDLRLRATEGMQLYGKLTGMHGGRVAVAPDLAHNLDAADEVGESIKRSIDGWIAKSAIEAPVEAAYTPPWRPPSGPGTERTPIDTAALGITSVIWCIGFRMNFSWVELPVFDERGAPRHRRGVTDQEGLYFLGLPWLHSWGSGRFSGIARDSEHLADQIARRVRR
ncbi:MSMEG_0569 family flavin-dependent oxidoreductase [Lichenicoccus sp.]|uniref:MSMEG_0569 family flavin-dependent oxidoreductase n=1 Tax=Lichenicoccus sp. TaxID=2781899 RepID=UPI003D1420C4